MRTAAIPVALRYAPFRGRDAVASGLLTRRQLDGRAWRQLFRDVYVCADVQLDHETWCHAAALLLPPGAALSHRSAAFLYGADVLPIDARVDVTVPPTERLRARFIRGHDGWPGARRARRAAWLAVPTAESPMETRLRLPLILAGLPEPAVQFDVFDMTGRLVGRLDLAYPRCRIGIEYEGDHHRERQTFQRDVARLNALRLRGWTILRFTADDVLRPRSRDRSGAGGVGRSHHG